MGRLRPGVSMGKAQTALAPRFLTTMQIPILAGREIDDRDQPGSTPVAVISEKLARTYFVNENPLGRRAHVQHCAHEPCGRSASGSDAPDPAIAMTDLPTSVRTPFNKVERLPEQRVKGMSDSDGRGQISGATCSWSIDRKPFSSIQPTCNSVAGRGVVFLQLSAWTSFRHNSRIPSPSAPG
jgi:hypothetical protein